jgi:hypothetical protein
LFPQFTIFYHSQFLGECIRQRVWPFAGAIPQASPFVFFAVQWDRSGLWALQYPALFTITARQGVPNFVLPLQGLSVANKDSENRVLNNRVFIFILYGFMVFRGIPWRTNGRCELGGLPIWSWFPSKGRFVHPLSVHPRPSQLLPK